MITMNKAEAEIFLRMVELIRDLAVIPSVDPFAQRAAELLRDMKAFVENDS